MKMGNQQELIEMLRGEEEKGLAGADIERMRWLNKPAEDMFTNAAVIEFLDPEMANSVLNVERLNLEGNPRKLCHFDKLCQSTQCFNCHKYDHIQTCCTRKPTYGYCSSKENNTSQHENKSDTTSTRGDS
jgi:hypothetical protein